MAFAPDSSTYLLLANDSALPNSQKLGVGPSLQLTSGGNQGTYILSIVGALESLINPSFSGLVFFNESLNNYTTRSITTDNTLRILYGNGIGGNPNLSVEPNTTTQLVNCISNGASINGAYPVLNFIGTGGASVNVNPNGAQGRFDITINASGGGGGGDLTAILGTADEITVTNGTGPIPTVSLASPLITPGNVTVDGTLTIGTGGDAYTLPDVDGTIGYVITAAADGATIWAPAGGGGGVSSIVGTAGQLTPITAETGAVTIGFVTATPVQFPNSITINYGDAESYTLPLTDGSNGQFITTDGNGNCTWASGGGGGGSITSVNGTTNQIEATNPGGPVVTLSLPNALIVPGYIQVTSYLDSPVINVSGDGFNYTFPLTNGSDGQVITWPSSGSQLTWEDVPTGVTTIISTENQILAENPSGPAVILSLDPDLIAPGTFTATTSITTPVLTMDGPVFNYSLPVTNGSDGQVISWPSSGTQLVWADAGGAGDITEVQGTANQIEVTSGTGPIPVIGFPTGTDVIFPGRIQTNNGSGANVSIGLQTLENLTSGNNIIAIGQQAGQLATSQSGSIFLGHQTGQNITESTANYLIGIGYAALQNAQPSGGGNCIGIGFLAMATYAGYNGIGIGFSALNNVAAGGNNLGIGNNVGQDAAYCDSSTFLGFYAGGSVQSSSSSTLIGFNAGGSSAATSFEDCTFIGAQSGNTTENSTNLTLIGKGAVGTSSTVNNQIVLGNNLVTTFQIPGIGVDFGLTVSNGLSITNTYIVPYSYTLPVTNGSEGQVISWPSSGTQLVWANAGGGDITEVQGTANQIEVTSGTGPIPVIGFPETGSVNFPNNITCNYALEGQYTLPSTYAPPGYFMTVPDDGNPNLVWQAFWATQIVGAPTSNISSPTQLLVNGSTLPQTGTCTLSFPETVIFPGDFTTTNATVMNFVPGEPSIEIQEFFNPWQLATGGAPSADGQALSTTGTGDPRNMQWITVPSVEPGDNFVTAVTFALEGGTTITISSVNFESVGSVVTMNLALGFLITADVTANYLVLTGTSTAIPANYYPNLEDGKYILLGTIDILKTGSPAVPYKGNIYWMGTATDPILVISLGLIQANITPQFLSGSTYTFGGRVAADSLSYTVSAGSFCYLTSL